MRRRRQSCRRSNLAASKATTARVAALQALQALRLTVPVDPVLALWMRLLMPRLVVRLQVPPAATVV